MNELWRNKLNCCYYEMSQIKFIIMVIWYSVAQWYDVWQWNCLDEMYILFKYWPVFIIN